MSKQINILNWGERWAIDIPTGKANGTKDKREITNYDVIHRLLNLSFIWLRKES